MALVQLTCNRREYHYTFIDLLVADSDGMALGARRVYQV